MGAYGLLDRLPLWTLFLFSFALFLLSIEGGYRLARYRQKRSPDEKETAAPVGAIVGALLGLLAFMQAFTFGMAASRFEERRQALNAEANAIRTTYLRAALLPEPITTDTRNILREYVDARLKGTRLETIDETIAKSREMHGRLWLQALAAGEKGKPPLSGLFIQSINEVIDLHAKRVTAGLRARVPGIIWIVLYVLAILGMSALGYQGGLAGKRRTIAVFIVISAFSMVLVLIADLDRPGDGLFRINQENMIDVRNSMS
jgi:hypothetical protein